MTIPIGRRGQVYVKEESSYGNPSHSHSDADAMRHIEIQLSNDPYARADSPEKKDDPGRLYRFDRRKQVELSTLSGIVRPSGALNTVPESDVIFRSAMGERRNVVQTMIVQASPAPTTTSATVDAVGSLAVGDPILINPSTSDPRVRWVASINGNDITWEPAMRPSAPGAGDPIKSACGYRLNDQTPISLFISHYQTDGTNRSLSGLGINQFALAFDANEEPRFTGSGPAQQQVVSPTKPSTFPIVGGNPPSGLAGEMWVYDGAGQEPHNVKFKTMEIALTNGYVVRNAEYGIYNNATEIYRSGAREIGVSIETYAEAKTPIYNRALAGSYIQIFSQTGYTEGNILAVYMPRVDIKVPETDDPDEEVSWTFTGPAIDTSDGANRELFVAFA